MIVGLEHWAQWAGTSPDGGKQPSSFKDYIRIICAKEGGTGASVSDSINALGNHLGRNTWPLIIWRTTISYLSTTTSLLKMVRVRIFALSRTELIVSITVPRKRINGSQTLCTNSITRNINPVPNMIALPPRKKWRNKTQTVTSMAEKYLADATTISTMVNTEAVGPYTRELSVARS